MPLEESRRSSLSSRPERQVNVSLTQINGAEWRDPDGLSSTGARYSDTTGVATTLSNVNVRVARYPVCRTLRDNKGRQTQLAELPATVAKDRPSGSLHCAPNSPRGKKSSQRRSGRDDRL